MHDNKTHNNMSFMGCHGVVANICNSHTTVLSSIQVLLAASQ